MKNLIALGKLLTLTAIIASTVGCSTNSAYQSAGTRYATTELERGTDAYTVFKNVIKWNTHKLTDVQSYKQQTAVYSALESEYGTVYNWFEDNAKGSVKAVHGYPQGSGFCRVVFSEVTVNYDTRSFRETACKETGHPGWRFIRK